MADRREVTDAGDEPLRRNMSQQSHGCKLYVVSHRYYNQFSNQVHDRDVRGRMRIIHVYDTHIVTHKQ